MCHSQSKNLNNLLRKAQQADSQSREQLAQWLCDEVQKKVASVLCWHNGKRAGGLNGASSPLASGMIQRSSIASKVVVKLIQGRTIERADGIGYLRCAIARAARDVLVDAYRRYDRRKRRQTNMPPADTAIWRQFDQDDVDVVELHRALEELETIDARKGSVVTLKYFCGLTIEEIANELRVSVSTVEADWRLARAWLKRRLDA